MSTMSDVNNATNGHPTSKRPRLLADSVGGGDDHHDDVEFMNAMNSQQHQPTHINPPDQQQQQLPSADMIRLVLSHLTECGLHDSTRILQQESGIGYAAVTQQQHDSIRRAAVSGQWGIVLQHLSLLDRERVPSVDIPLVAAVHEMTILELAELGEWEIAFSIFRLFQQDEEISTSISEIAATASNQQIAISRSLEQKLAHLMAERDKDLACTVPNDFYGADKSNDVNIKQLRRDTLGKRLQNAIPIQPVQRLPTLIQQAMKWQSYTGQVPTIRRAWLNDKDGENNDDTTNVGDDNEKQRKCRKEFDLVLGEVSVDTISFGSRSDRNVPLSSKDMYMSGVDYATIKFGKKATAEVITFLPDGTGLVTGSSDGLVEIWGIADGKLRTNDLLYQQNDELIGHDTGAIITAIAISNDTTLIASGAADGIVHIWRFDTGKCLRTIQTAATCSINSAVSCMCFSPDSSHVLTGTNDGICREFGLRTSRMLKEFRGHTSYITSCYYHLTQSSMTASNEKNNNDDVQLLVVTASGDGTVRIWDGKTMDTILVLQPISVGLRNDTLSQVGTSIAALNIERLSQTSSNEGSPSIHTILKLHTPTNTMIIVPRGRRAFLVDYTGRVLRIFQEPENSKVEACYVVATVTPSNRWLYMVRDDGICCIFDIPTGKLERIMNDFGARCISSSSSTTAQTTPPMINFAEITSIVHHPTNGVLAAFSNHKGQKRGKVVLWK